MKILIGLGDHRFYDHDLLKQIQIYQLFSYGTHFEISVSHQFLKGVNLKLSQICVYLMYIFGLKSL